MASALLKIFQRQIVPWIEQFGISRIAVAGPSWQDLRASESALPVGFEAVQKTLASKRVPVRGRKLYGNAALIDARWPQDRLHSSRAPMLEFVLSGAVAFPLGDYELRCRPGYGVLTPPGVAHSDGSHLLLDKSVANNNACEILKMRPYKGGLECWLSHTRNGEHWSHRVSDESCRISNLQAVFYLETFTEEALKGRAHHEQICNALLVALMNLLLRELEISPALLPMPAIQNELQFSGERNPNVIEQSKDYIRGHIGEALTLNKVARYVYMSERSFSHQFRKATGQSFLEYLTDCRYKEAMNLLKSTDWSIEQIAGFLGIKTGRLRALFHQRIGISPTAYRQSNKIAEI